MFRTTPQLGPQLNDKSAKFHWDGANITDVSPRLGTREIGSDGHTYVLVKAAGTVAADSGVSINESTWVASADASDPEWEVPADVTGGVVLNDIFWARATSINV